MIDWDFIISHFYLFKGALWLTLQISALGIALSVIIGAICAVVLVETKDIHKSASIDSAPATRAHTPLMSAFLRALRLVISGYVELSRNTPLLIQLFFLYFALPKIGIKLDAFSCAVVGLAFLGGGYMCEAFRAGLESVSRSQVESALSIGLSRFGVICFVRAPQALGVAMPALSANVIFLIKETSIVGVLALGDVLYVSKDIIDLYGKTYEALIMLIAIYLVILLPISLVFGAVESHLKKRI
ncbi:hypothetical protein BKN38_04595 [Helicobacter sp. CLO-3]|nr:amino acid ABC transporter permease [Helicobacter sp. CLO-3]OBV29837.1 hypothetical protein BA723_04090 [Helicobacter sp. CLO-3]OHU83992.1 hypothetical protein BKN38_04595 [Helicobacter sp. CLO-3]